MVAAADPSPPPLTESQVAVLNAFLASNFDLAATTAAAGITLPDLLDWHRAPAVQAALDDLEALQSRADELQLAAARRDAVKELHGILRDTQSDPVERRRAATALLRPRAATRGIGFQPISNKRGQPPLVVDATSDSTPTVDRGRHDLAIAETSPSPANLDAVSAVTPGSTPASSASPSSSPSEIPNLKSEISVPPAPILTRADFAAHLLAALSGAPPPHNSA